MTELFDKIQRGDRESYKQMFLIFYPALCEYATRFITATDAEELVQDLMLHVWETRKTMVIGSSLKSYLFVAVRNRCYNSIRNRQYKQQIHTQIYEKLKDRFDDPDYYMANELADNIQKAVSELPANYREVFELSRFGSKSNQEIADQLNVSVKTIEYRITQSLKILRKTLKDYLPMLTFMI